LCIDKTQREDVFHFFNKFTDKLISTVVKEFAADRV